MTRRLGVAIVGTGSIADYHIGGIGTVPGAEMRCVVGRNADKAATLAKRYGIGASSANLAAVLARADIDAVIVATPDNTHEDLAAQVATAGKALLLQKPMAGDVAGCRRIVARAAAAKIDLQVSFMHRYFDEFLRARELIADGAIGALQSIRIRNATPGPDWGDWFYKRANVSGGVVHQLGVHGIDLVRLVAGEIASVSATTAILKPVRTLADGRCVTVENPDSAWAVYRCEAGVVASHEMSFVEVAGCERFRLEFYGSHGTIWVRSEIGALAWRCDGEREWRVEKFEGAHFGERHHKRWIAGLVGELGSESTATDAVAGLQVATAIAASAAAQGAAVPC
ncbi:MAG: Gfo/Idh/MocA family oxidoreductase [Magnetospirillum sp.]|jgi:predicted dehydrogenase|nr:Gfo/Idh/MocA family oxidoreductase [Magnetospirillum sp.]